MLRYQIIILYIISFVLINTQANDYWQQREEFLSREKETIIGHSQILNEKEQKVDDLLLNYKAKLFDDSIENPELYLPGKHFFKVREQIADSDIFKIIKILPKGASLHSHDFAMVSHEFLLNNITYMEDLYACIVNGKLKLKFMEKPNTDCNWKLLSELRSINKTAVDDYVAKQISIIVDDPDESYPNGNVVWKKFESVFDVVDLALCYRPAFEIYIQQVLQELYDDNVMYLEFRGYLPMLYDFNQTYSLIETMGIYKMVSDRFIKSHEGFLGVRFIYAPFRRVNNQTMHEYMQTARELHAAYPNFMIGFDLVGQEDLGMPLINFVEELQELGKEMNLFFHAGETNWYGTSIDNNLIDAILLGTRRIGHGYAMLKHPQVIQAVKERGIAIEVSPISNQVLKLVDDIRNHVAVNYIANDVPVVVTNDDPCHWGAKGLSYDWYMAFMGLTSKTTGLTFLKQLAINSLEYSAMDNATLSNAFKLWHIEWDKFIDRMLYDYSNEIY